MLGDGGVVPDPDRATRLVQLDAEIIRAGTQAGILGDAIERLTTVAADTRREVEAEYQAMFQAAARTVVAKMLPLAEDLIALNKQLIDIGERSPVTLLAPPPALLIHWMEQARGVLRG